MDWVTFRKQRWVTLRARRRQLGLSEPLLPEGADQAGHLPPPLDLVRGVLAGGDALEMCDQGVAIGEPAGPDAIDDAASEDLLSASAADAEQKLELSAGDTGAGIGSKFLQNMGQITIPAGFSGHGGFPYGIARSRTMPLSPKKDKVHYPSFTEKPSKYSVSSR